MKHSPMKIRFEFRKNLQDGSVQKRLVIRVTPIPWLVPILCFIASIPLIYVFPESWYVILFVLLGIGGYTLLTRIISRRQTGG